MLNVTLIGTSGMMPLKNRWLSSCLLNTNGHSVLIDCGEGTQIAMKCAGQRFKPVDVICITHFHADHISGLPGFLLTLCSEGRTEPVTIVGPAGLSRVVKALCMIAPNLTYEVRCEEYTGGQFSLQADALKITPFPVKHGIPCLGYRFDMERVGKFDPEKAAKNNVPGLTLRESKVMSRMSNSLLPTISSRLQLTNMSLSFISFPVLSE